MKSKILLVMLVLISLLAAGCNEEEKYNTAKNEYQQMREEISRLELTTGEDRKLVNGKWTESTLAINEEALRKHDELVPKMEINNDFARIKEDYRQHAGEWASRVKQAEQKVAKSKVKHQSYAEEAQEREQKMRAAAASK